MTRQFQAFRTPYPELAEGAPFLVVLQSDAFAKHSTVVVAPLVSEDHVGLLRTFRPRLEIEGRRYALNTLQVGTIPVAYLGPPVAELDRYRIIESYDALISGSAV